MAYPEETLPQIWDGVKEFWNKKVVNGTAEDRANVAGQAVFEIASWLVGAGEAKAAVSGAKAAYKAGDTARVLEKIGDTGNVLSKAGKKLAGGLDNVINKGIKETGDAIDSLRNKINKMIGQQVEFAGIGSLDDMGITAENIRNRYNDIKTIITDKMFKSESSGVKISDGNAGGVVDEIAGGKGASGAVNTGKVLNNGHSLDDMAELYAKNVNGNGKWSWMDDFPDAGSLSKADKASIKNLAIEKGLIPDVPVKTITDSAGKTYRYADFDSVGLTKQKVSMPKDLWSETDAVQFKWLDDQIGGRPQGYTWHHSEISGQMELVPTGIHNIYNHNGGRTAGHWAYREGGR